MGAVGAAASQPSSARPAGPNQLAAPAALLGAEPDPGTEPHHFLLLPLPFLFLLPPPWAPAGLRSEEPGRLRPRARGRRRRRGEDAARGARVLAILPGRPRGLCCDPGAAGRPLVKSLSAAAPSWRAGERTGGRACARECAPVRAGPDLPPHCACALGAREHVGEPRRGAAGQRAVDHGEGQPLLHPAAEEGACGRWRRRRRRTGG